MKKVISWVLTIALLFSLVPAGTFDLTAEAATVASGKCGTNLTWTLDDEGTLTISGTGDMDDYSEPPYAVAHKTAPWYYKRNSIKTIVIEPNVSSIGKYAFYDCTGLSGEIVIPDDVTIINDYAFSKCTGLTSVFIGDSLTAISSLAFSGCTKLAGIWVSDGNTEYSSDESGVLFNKEKNELILAPYALSGNYTISDSVTNIGNNAFLNCTGLTSVTIRSNVRTIGDSAFRGCTGLTSVTLPENLISIGWNTFSQCTGLKEICFKGPMPQTGAHAFEGVTATAYYYPGESWTEYAMQSLNKDGTITWVARERESNIISSGTCGDNLTWTLDEEGTLTISGTGDMTDYSRVEAPWWYYYSKTIKTIIIESGVTSIGSNAFENCANLTSVTIPDSLTSIGSLAFYYCSSLESIAIPDSVTSLGLRAFDRCSKLNDIELPQTAIAIGAGAFDYTQYLMDRGKYQYVTLDNHLIYVRNVSPTYKLELPEGIITIADGAASYTALSGVVIPGSVKRIGSNAFYTTHDRFTVQLSEGVEFIGDNAFPSKMSSLHIPASVKHIGIISAPVSVTVEEGNIRYHSTNNCLIETESKTLIVGPCEINIPSDGSVTKIGDCAFSECLNTKITIPDCITSIGTGAFGNCQNVKELSLPNTITELGEDVFGFRYLEHIFFRGNRDEWIELITKYPETSLLRANVHFLIDHELVAEGSTAHIDEVPEGYIGIYTKQDLDNIRNDLEGKYILMNSIIFKDEDFQEAGAFYNNGIGWLPIGNSAETAFRGVLNGNGYSIVNMHIDYSLVEEQNQSRYVGLFGYNQGRIERLTILGGKIFGTTAIYGMLYVGAVAGYDEGTVYDCVNTSSISVGTNHTESAAYGGGIVGYSVNNTIASCRNYGRVSVSAFNGAGASAGGITGRAYAIENCVNNGAVDSTYARAGGIAGEVVRSVAGCKNTGSVAAGGAAGICYSAKEIISCFNSGTIQAESQGTARAGGITVTSQTIERCGNIGEIKATARYGNGTMYAIAGGIVAETNQTTVKNSFNAGKITVYSASTSVNSPTNYAGGIIGTRSLKIENCYNIGSVRAQNNRYQGDLIGYGDGTAKGCVYSGDNVGVGVVNSGAVQCNIDEMKKQSSYPLFDFDTVWTIDETSEYPYPVPIGLEMEETIKLLDITISAYPEKLVYQQGEQLDFSGLVVMAHYTDGFSAPIQSYSIYGETETVGKQQIIIELAGKKAAIEIEVVGNAILGDIDGDDTVDQDDVVYLLLHTMFGENFYPLNSAPGDIDHNGKIEQDDAVYLLLHTMFGEAFYPLN